jgi:glycerol-3-phosphate acyltransferase PlsX
MAVGVIKSMVSELAEMLPDVGGGDKSAMLMQSAKRYMAKYDFNEYGGAPLLGVAGICIICHGASDHRGIMNAVRSARTFAEHRVNQQITETLSEGTR